MRSRNIHRQEPSKVMFTKYVLYCNGKWTVKHFPLTPLYKILISMCASLELLMCSCIYGFALKSENRYREKGGLKFLPSFKIQHNKYSKIVRLALPRQEKYPAFPGFSSQPAQNRPSPVCPAYLVHTAATVHFFIRYSYIIHFFQNDVTTVLDVD